MIAISTWGVPTVRSRPGPGISLELRCGAEVLRNDLPTAVAPCQPRHCAFCARRRPRAFARVPEHLIPIAGTLHDHRRCRHDTALHIAAQPRQPFPAPLIEIQLQPPDAGDIRLRPACRLRVDRVHRAVHVIPDAVEHIEPLDRLRPRQVLHALDFLHNWRRLPPGHRQQRHGVTLPDHRFEIRQHVRTVVIVHWYGPGYSIFSARANAALSVQHVSAWTARASLGVRYASFSRRQHGL